MRARLNSLSGRDNTVSGCLQTLEQLPPRPRRLLRRRRCGTPGLRGGPRIALRIVSPDVGFPEHAGAAGPRLVGFRVALGVGATDEPEHRGRVPLRAERSEILASRRWSGLAHPLGGKMASAIAPALFQRLNPSSGKITDRTGTKSKNLRLSDAAGFLYLVAIIDWATRRVLSWRLSNTLTAGCCVEALSEALARFGKPGIFNTDQGAQSTSDEFTKVLRIMGS